MSTTEDAPVLLIVLLVLIVADVDIVVLVEVVAYVEEVQAGEVFILRQRKKNKKSYRSNSTNSNGVYSSRKSVQSRKTSVSPLKYYNTNDEKTITLETITEITNIRKYPSSKSKIVEKVEKNSILILQENSGKWLKVKVKKSGNMGFVYYKNVR